MLRSIYQVREKFPGVASVANASKRMRRIKMCLNIAVNDCYNVDFCILNCKKKMEFCGEGS